MVNCRSCGASEGFTTSGELKRLCSKCARARVEKSSKGTLARQLFTALKQRLRKQGSEDGKYWRLLQVEELLEESGPWPEGARLRIVKRDEEMPLRPGNGKLVPWGVTA